ncbi:pyridoxamine 5'-phosphate oxidase [Candidatus Endobugula sertula]|uniref:Pyridoxine/pyridoxamine 5'-phosphate oxidase n=1 Tax=Candidatus Endobugula sertula TaxID=62101 RepID=A0A1D2QNE2_9GAMM|nr:pyridoxamine 5'-phosphate oxidase [Candidatus Endobugula sertula]
MKLQDFRREYLQGGLRRHQLNNDPILQFKAWLHQAIEAQICDPTAMTLATVDEQRRPSQRIVLLKQVDHQGFVFFTNKQSHKARMMLENDRVGLHFPWYPLERQVSIGGRVESLPLDDVKNYFASRPKDSQLSAWASHQSEIISSREHLIKQYTKMQEKYANSDIPLPDFWGGYRVVPDVVEFWQGGARRLHDRFLYTLTPEGEWRIDRLSP